MTCNLPHTKCVIQYINTFHFGIHNIEIDSTPNDM